MLRGFDMKIAEGADGGDNIAGPEREDVTGAGAGAMTFSVLLQWVANAVVLLFPYAFHIIGKAVTLGFLAVMCLTQAAFTWRYVPETKNKPLEEIEAHWSAS
jgi:hypothetical protein